MQRREGEARPILSGASMLLMIAATVWGLVGLDSRLPAGVAVSIPPCASRPRDSTVARVTTSPAFLAALNAAARASAAPHRPLYQQEINEVCERFEVARPRILGGMRIAYSPVPGLDATLYFGVRDDRIILLNRIVNGTLTDGVSTESWNQFSSPDSLDGSDLLGYSCLIYALHNRQFPSATCPGEHRFLIERVDSGGVSVSLVALHTQLVFDDARRLVTIRPM